MWVVFDCIKKQYSAEFHLVSYPNGWHVPNFVKFSGDDITTTLEHISLYIVQLGEACSSLKPTQKCQHEEVHFTFDVLKCDRIFDELLKKETSSYHMPYHHFLKLRAYCKLHNYSSHSTNDCNIFHQHRYNRPSMKDD